MSIEEERAESRRRTGSRVSAESFLKEGIRRQQDDLSFARLNFDLAEKFFAEAGDYWNAQIARRWKSSVSEVEGAT